MATTDRESNSSTDSQTSILVRKAESPRSVTVDVPGNLARAISTACLARAEYFEAYGAGESSATLEGISKEFVDGHDHGSGVEVGVIHLEVAADATEWFAHELIRNDDFDAKRIDGLDRAVGALRSALIELRAAFQLSPRDQLDTTEGL